MQPRPTMSDEGMATGHHVATLLVRSALRLGTDNSLNPSPGANA